MGTTTHGTTASLTSEAAERLHDHLQASPAVPVTSEDWQQGLESAAGT